MLELTNAHTVQVANNKKNIIPLWVVCSNLSIALEENIEPTALMDSIVSKQNSQLLTNDWKKSCKYVWRIAEITSYGVKLVRYYIETSLKDKWLFYLNNKKCMHYADRLSITRSSASSLRIPVGAHLCRFVDIRREMDISHLFNLHFAVSCRGNAFTLRKIMLRQRKMCICWLEIFRYASHMNNMNIIDWFKCQVSSQEIISKF